MDDGSRSEKGAPTLEEITASQHEIAIGRIGFFERAIEDYSEELETETDPEERAKLQTSIETMRKKLSESRELLGATVTNIASTSGEITPEAILNASPSDEAKNADA